MDKICSKCEIPKELNHFAKDRKSKDGLQSYCKKCKSELISLYYKNNPDKRAKLSEEARRRKGLKSYYKNRVSMNFSRLLRRSLNGSKNGAKWETIVGYSLNDLKNHLESKFLKGMNWDNYGEWHIDHIRPIASFNFKSSEDKDFKICWSLSNLQPLWAKDNFEKSNKYVGIF